MILVVGASGNLGGLIARRLLSQGQPLRILARPQSSYQQLAGDGAETVFGDLKDRASLGAACAGADVVITTANSVLRGGEDNLQTVDLEGNRNLIDAAREAGVKQFIFISALGVTADSPVPLFQAKAGSEAYLRASGLPYTILAPHAFLEVWATMIVAAPARAGSRVRLVGEGRRLHSFISIQDVAAFATAVIGHPAAINRHLALGGPEAISWRDVIAAFERALGCRIEVESLPAGAPVPGFPEAVAHLMAGFDLSDVVIEMGELAREFGIEQATLDQYVRGMLASTAV